MTRLLPVAVGVALLFASGAIIANSGRSAAPRDTVMDLAGLPAGVAGRATAPGRLIVTDFRGSETLLLSLSANDPADRRTLLRIPHVPNWAPRVAIAPGGDLVAYTNLPAGARTPDTEADLWVVSLSGRDPRRLAQRVDLRSAPVWATDGSRVAYLRVTPGTGAGTTLTVEEVTVRRARPARWRGRRRRRGCSSPGTEATAPGCTMSGSPARGLPARGRPGGPDLAPGGAAGRRRRARLPHRPGRSQPRLPGAQRTAGALPSD
ncbi:MAG: hypothetical protein U0531_12435 [Dehalococcoidia bacterium]